MDAFTLLSSLVFGFFLPDSLRNPHSTFLPKQRLFTEREIYILTTRVPRDGPSKGQKKKRIGLRAFKKTFSNWRLWVHTLITLCNNGLQRGFDTYAPSLVREFGFGDLTANALASVGLFIQIPVSFLFSWLSDRYSRRGETVITCVNLVTLASLSTASSRKSPTKVCIILVLSGLRSLDPSHILSMLPG